MHSPCAWTEGARISQNVHAAKTTTLKRLLRLFIGILPLLVVSGRPVVASSSWEVIIGQIFELAGVFRIRNRVKPDTPPHSVGEKERTDMDCHFTYGIDRQIAWMV